MLTEKEKKLRQHQKELKSFRNKMNGCNIIWFDSLIKTKQYDLLFEWKKNKQQSIKKDTRPPSLKRFIIRMKLKLRYKINISRARDVAIDLLLK